MADVLFHHTGGRRMQVPFQIRPTIPAHIWYELTWPKVIEPNATLKLLQALGGNKASQDIRAVVIARPGVIKHYLAVPEQNCATILASLSSFIPGIEAVECEPVDTKAKYAAQLRMTSKQRVLNADLSEIISKAVLTNLKALESRERVTISLVLGACKAPVAIPNDYAAFHSTSLTGATGEALVGRAPAKLDSTALYSMREKNASSSWEAALYIGLDTSSDARRAQLLEHIVGGFNTGDAAGVRLAAKKVPVKRLTNTYRPLFWPLRFNVDELVGFLLWPPRDVSFDGVERVNYRRVLPSFGISGRGLILGDSDYGKSQPIVLQTNDRLTHLELVGPSGSGKSTLMEHCIVQDAADGRGLAFIDLKGDSFRNVLARLPANRLDDVVAIDLSKSSLVIGVNPLARPLDPNQVADDIIAIFIKLFGDAIGARTNDILHTGLLTLMQVPGMSIAALPPLLTDDAFRQSILARVADPWLLQAWQMYERRSMNDRNMAILPLMNKLQPLLLRPAIRRTICQSKPKFDIADIFLKRKILLVNLSEASGKEGAPIVGAWIMTLLMDAIRRLSSLPPEKRHIVPLYIDEAQEYWRRFDDFKKALETFRSNKIPITFAHQHLGQMGKEDREGLVNARSTVCFQQGHDDAVIHAKSSTLLTPEDFEHLPAYHAYARLAVNGQVMPWVSMATRPPIEPANDPASILAKSRELYGVPAIEIEQQLQSFYQSDKTRKFQAATEESPTVDTPPLKVDFPIGHRKASFPEQININYQQRLQNGEV